MLAGVAATGEEEVFSIISAGIFFIEKYPTKPQEITIQLCRKAGEVRVFRLRYLKVSSPLKKRKEKILRCVSS